MVRMVRSLADRTFQLCARLGDEVRAVQAALGQLTLHGRPGQQVVLRALEVPLRV